MMAMFPFQPEDYLDATEARDSLKPRDAADFDSLMNAIADLLNNKVMRVNGSIPAEDDQDFGGFSLLNVGDMVLVDDNGDPVARLHVNEAATPSELQIEFNSGTAENPVWEDTLAVELDGSPQLLLQDNTGLKFPDGSQIHSDDFDNNGNVKLTTDQLENAIKYLASEYQIGDTDSDTNNWSWTENANGHIEFSHAELPGPLLLRQDGTIEIDGQTGDPGADDRLVPKGYVDSSISNISTTLNRKTVSVDPNSTKTVSFSSIDFQDIISIEVVPTANSGADFMTISQDDPGSAGIGYLVRRNNGNNYVEVDVVNAQDNNTIEVYVIVQHE